LNKVEGNASEKHARKTSLNASCGSDQDKKTDDALVAAMGDAEVVALVLAGVADMRTRISSINNSTAQRQELS
jgi:hypothetical protein